MATECFVIGVIDNLNAHQIRTVTKQVTWIHECFTKYDYSFNKNVKCLHAQCLEFLKCFFHEL